MSKFGLILADPPWSYANYGKAVNGAAASAYACMAIEDIKAIPVEEKWAADNCVLALWTTGPMIAQGTATAVIKAWGFVGKTMLPWIKNSPTTQDLATGVGIWFQGNAEYVIFATRGKVGGFFEKGPDDPKPRKKRGGNLGILVGDRDDPEFWLRVSERALLSPKSRKHSAKPRGLIDYCQSFPGPYLELFAREKRPGWVSVGLDLGWELGPWGARRLSQTPDAA